MALRFLTQIGASYTVEAKSTTHFTEDLSIFDLKLSDGELRAPHPPPTQQKPRRFPSVMLS